MATEKFTPEIVDCVYAAAFIDADGCISLWPDPSMKSGQRCQIKVVQCKRNGNEPLLSMQRIWGGSLCLNSADMWHLGLQGLDAAIMLMDIEQFMTIKRKKAQLALKHFWDNPKIARALARIYGAPIQDRTP